MFYITTALKYTVFELTSMGMGQTDRQTDGQTDGSQQCLVGAITGIRIG